MNNLEQYVPQVHFEQIPIKNLVSNQEYQRNLSLAHIQRAADNFDLYQINPVKVSRRDGINYVFNGQHTIEIVALVSGSRETPVWCMVYDELCYEHEADIFANQMKFVKPLSAYEIFIANIEAGNDQQILIKTLVESFGLQIGSKKAPKVINAVSTLEAVFEKYGYHVLSRTLRLLIATWEGDMQSFSANMLNAVAKLIAVYQDQMDDESFKEKLGAVSLKSLIRNAKERRPGSMGYAEAIILEYNGKRKNPHTRLAMNKLYARDNLFVEDDYEYEEEIEEDTGENDDE
jgi:hypothetical protein